jgi:hypothetical protein
MAGKCGKYQEEDIHTAEYGGELRETDFIEELDVDEKIQ